MTTGAGIALALALVVAAAGWANSRRRHEVRLLAGTGRRPASAGLSTPSRCCRPRSSVAWPAGSSPASSSPPPWGPPPPRAPRCSRPSCGARPPSSSRSSSPGASPPPRPALRRAASGGARAQRPVGARPRRRGCRRRGRVFHAPGGERHGTWAARRPRPAARGRRRRRRRLPPLLRPPAPTALRPPSAHPPDRGRVAGRPAPAGRGPDARGRRDDHHHRGRHARLLPGQPDLHRTHHRGPVLRARGSRRRPQRHVVVAPGPRRPATGPRAGGRDAAPTTDLPVARNPVLPAGQSVTWRTRTTIATTGESVELLLVDPSTFAAAADWGSEGRDGRPGPSSLLPELASSSTPSQPPGPGATASAPRSRPSSSGPSATSGWRWDPPSPSTHAPHGPHGRPPER